MLANVLELALIVAVLAIFFGITKSSNSKKMLAACQVQGDMPGVKTFRYNGKLFDKERYISVLMKGYAARGLKKEKVQKLIDKFEAKGTNDELDAVHVETLKRLLKNYK